MPIRTRDLRVESIRPLLPPAILLEELPVSETAALTIARGREEIVEILDGTNDRLVVIIGPCSIHDPTAAMEYARRLRKLADELAADLRIVMRVYFEKPRTTVGWKGLINDPRLDGSFVINEGLRLGRRFLLDLADMGLPAGCEFLDPISPQFISDLVTWGAIGARTTESQVHRELASGLSMPVGFKNSTGGGVQVAIDGIRSAQNPHHFLNLMLFSSTVAYQRGLDLQRAVLKDLDTRSCRSNEYGATSLPEFERTFDVYSEERVFDCAGLRRQTLDHLFNLLAYCKQPVSEAQMFWPSYRSVFDKPIVAAIAIDYTITCTIAARVYSDDSHYSIFRRSHRLKECL